MLSKIRIYKLYVTSLFKHMPSKYKHIQLHKKLRFQVSQMMYFTFKVHHIIIKNC